MHSLEELTMRIGFTSAALGTSLLLACIAIALTTDHLQGDKPPLIVVISGVMILGGMLLVIWGSVIGAWRS